jgi:hypothetical protein
MRYVKVLQYVNISTIRKPRARKVVDESTNYRSISHLPDVSFQQERDRQPLHERPLKVILINGLTLVMQNFLFSYDVEKEVSQS